MSLVQILVCAYIVKFINFALCCMMVRQPEETFLYFAYGSNLLKKRIHINNPSAIFLGIGRLDNYQLDFVGYYKMWEGAVATIVPNSKEHVWGAVWRMDKDNIFTLDKQEGVQDKLYIAKIVDIHTADGQIKRCRTYQHTTIPSPLKPGTSLPDDRRPSHTYKDCIVSGAIECKMPQEYIAKLKKIPTNGLFASSVISKGLNL